MAEYKTIIYGEKDTKESSVSLYESVSLFIMLRAV